MDFIPHPTLPEVDLTHTLHFNLCKHIVMLLQFTTVSSARISASFQSQYMVMNLWHPQKCTEHLRGKSCK